MFPKDLNTKFNYTLKGATYTPTASELRWIYDRGVTESDWKKEGWQIQRLQEGIEGRTLL
jgi:hypothetical protein